jgi:serine/threonine-protein kinase
MVTADLGACEWLVWDLRRSNLVDRGKLEQIIAEFMQRHPRAEPQNLADYLVEQNVLSRFQADSLLNNKAAGLVMGPFVMMDVLGTGSMGTVYKAQSKVNGEWYAVKVLPRRSMWNIRVAKRKVRDFEQIKHPAVVPFVDVGTSGSTHYLAWPYVEGMVLSRLVESRGRLTMAEAALYGMQIAEGLDACHQKGILHGLLKPANLLVTPENQVKILDFGVGSLMGETESESVVDTMSTANTMASSLECASPESIMDPTSVSPASDQYSLGCVLYFCLAGQYPFPGNNAVEKMMLHQTKEPTPVTVLAPETSAELVVVVERLMRKSPADRYPSMNDAVMALRPLAMGSLGAMVQQVRPLPRAMPVPQAAPAGGWPVASPPDEADLPPMPAPDFGDPTFGEPAPPSPVPGRQGASGRRSSGYNPAMPQPDAYGQPPMPNWRNQQHGYPDATGSGAFPPLPPMPPLPNLPGRELYSHPVQHDGTISNKLMILGFLLVAIISMGLGAALIWFFK